MYYSAVHCTYIVVYLSINNSWCVCVCICLCVCAVKHVLIVCSFWPLTGNFGRSWPGNRGLSYDSDRPIFIASHRVRNLWRRCAPATKIKNYYRFLPHWPPVLLSRLWIRPLSQMKLVTMLIGGDQTFLTRVVQKKKVSLPTKTLKFVLYNVELIEY